MFLTQQFWLIIFWSYEPCRYFTAGKIVERWNLLIFTTSQVVFCEMFASVDKLEAVPILCVEQLVSSLFCINASQSSIISLWRNVPVCLLFLLKHYCLYQAGLLTIYYAVVCQEQSSWFLCILVLLLIWVLHIVVACAASGCTTVDYPLVLSQRRDLCW